MAVAGGGTDCCGGGIGRAARRAGDQRAQGMESYAAAGLYPQTAKGGDDYRGTCKAALAVRFVSGWMLVTGC